jgi:hypothetical protein
MVPGMRGLYTHVSHRMRAALMDALQARWESSLRARAAIHPHSPVRLLDDLLAPHRPDSAGNNPVHGTRQHPLIQINPGRQGEDDLPNSSQAS